MFVPAPANRTNTPVHYKSIHPPRPLSRVRKFPCPSSARQPLVQTFLNRSELPKSGQNIPKNRCWTTIAERMAERRAELPFIGDQVVC